MNAIRKEASARFKFAKERGEHWFNKMKSVQQNGNVLSSKPTRKFKQACRIYDYYLAEFTKFIKRNGEADFQR